jgi:hypothetical protein
MMRSDLGHRLTTLALAGAVLAVGAHGFGADDEPLPEGKWGVRAGLTFGEAGGGYGSFLEKPIAAELDLFRQRGSWRWGFGLSSFGSLDMKAPYEDEQEWALHQFYFSGARVFRADKRVRPYLEIRAGLARVHPRSELFATGSEEDLEPGESPTKPVNGFAVTALPGLELALNRRVAFDLAAYYTYFQTSAYDLSPIGREPVDSGRTWGGRLGIVWRPAAIEEGGGDKPRDAWGVGRNYGWAAVEVMAINSVGTVMVEFVRKANFGQISPRSFWHNIDEGFTYDDNEFKTNQFIHPFNGSTYYNSARANGLNFWTSYGYAVAGAFMWECCGETHPMSYNDMISTGIGGAAFGEMQYRLTSVLLDNTKKGRGRRWREAGAFVLDPVRGFNRVVSGQAGRVTGNPESPYDWRPPHFGTFLATGVRVIGEGESITENTKTYGFFELDFDYGSAFENERRRPFDRFDTAVQVNVGEKVPIGRLQIRGDLFSRALGDGADPNHAFAVTQHFDYINNTAYEFGGQSFGPSFFSRFRLSDRVALRTRIDLMATILGAVNSEYAAIADVPDRERLREYDYGPGIGANASVTLSISKRPVLSIFYRYQHLRVRNGSVFNNDRLGGSDANHDIQAGGVRLAVPLFKGIGLGADAYVFLRDSEYSFVGFNDIHQRNPQARVYLAWSQIR